MRADTVIIGAGVYGAALAWELARRGREALVLEAGTIASGASGGLGKRGVRANGRDVRELPLMRRAYEIWPVLADMLDGETGFERVGHLELIERPEDVARAPARCAAQRHHGVSTNLLGESELRGLEPEMADTVRAALHCPEDGVADHTATTRAYARAAERRGARFLEMTRVIRLVADAARVRAVVTSEEDRIEVDSAVVVLANQGVAELVATLGARLGGTREQRDRAAGGTERRLASPGPASLATFPVWPQVLVTQPLARAVVHHLIGHSHRRLALKSLPDGSLMITGGWLGVWNSERGVGEPVAEAVAGNLAEAIAVFPCLAGTDVRWAVADRLESVSSDLVPIIDAVPGVTNCLFATGWSGHGWAIAPAVTELMATWLLEGDRPATLAPFALSRPALRS